MKYKYRTNTVLFIILFVFSFICISCQNPFNAVRNEENKPHIPAGMGALSVRFANTNFRTILPVVSLETFTYKLTISRADPDFFIEEEFDRYADLLDAVFILEEGIYDLEVIACLPIDMGMGPSRPAARGKTEIIIVGGEYIFCELAMKMIGISADGMGLFHWNITLPGNSDSFAMFRARMIIKSLPDGDETELYFTNAPEGKENVGTLDSRNLNSGYYQITFRLERDNFYDPFTWMEILHIYDNMVSYFEHEFNEDIYNKFKYTVTFNYNDGVNPHIAHQTRAYGDMASAPDDPEREEYLFLGWYDNNNDLFDFSTPLTGSFTLTAQWQPVLTGTAFISGTYKIGQTLTVVTNSLGGGSGAVSYSWKSQKAGENVSDIGTNSETYTITGADVEKIMSCVITRAGAVGYITARDEQNPARAVPYTIKLDVSGSEDGDTVSFSENYMVHEMTALSGNIPVYYTIANSGYSTQELWLSCLDMLIMNPGQNDFSGSINYTINPSGDAINGIITITAEFIHTNKIVLDAPIEASFAHDGTITFTVGANNEEAKASYTYTLHKDNSIVDLYIDKPIANNAVAEGIVDKMLESDGAYTVTIKAHTVNESYHSPSFSSDTSNAVYVHKTDVVLNGALSGETINDYASDFTFNEFRGTDITLTAVPNAGRKVTWSGAGTASGNAYSINDIQANASVTAAFSAGSQLNASHFAFDNTGKTYNSDSQGVNVEFTGEDADTTVGTVATYYSGTAYMRSQTAPTDAGTYTVWVTTSGGAIFEAVTIDHPLLIGQYTINKKPLEIIHATHTKMYDGNTNVAGTGIQAIAISFKQDEEDGIEEDDIDQVLPNAITAVYTSKNAETTTINITGVTLMGNRASNYSVTPKNNVMVAGITHKPLTVNMVHTKEYDGSTDIFDVVSVAISGKVSADDLTVSCTGASYTSKAVGTKTIIITDLILAGNDKDNYTITMPDDGVWEVSGITKRRLTIGEPESSNSWTREYNGSAEYSDFSIGAIGRNINGEDVGVLVTSAAYNNANAAINKTITVIYELNGNDADNYLPPVNSVVTSAIVTKASGAGIKGAITEDSRTSSVITIKANGVTVSEPNPPKCSHISCEQKVQYAISAALIDDGNTVALNTLNWQTAGASTTSFSSLTWNTLYYIYARSGGNTNYTAGTMIISAEIRTRKLSLAAYDFTLSKNSKTYNMKPEAAEVAYRENLNPAATGTITVYYSGKSGTSYPERTTAPVNAGTYDVWVTTTEDDNYEARSKIDIGDYTIKKSNDSRNVAVLSLSSRTTTAITVTAVLGASNEMNSEQTAIQYARSSNATVPSTGWTYSQTFTGLSPNTEYYFFARAAASTNIETGNSCAGVLMKTNARADVIIKPDGFDWDNNIKIEENNVEIGAIVLSRTARNEVIITIDEANSAGFTFKWFYNGVELKTTGVSNSGKTFTLTVNQNNAHYNIDYDRIGRQVITVQVTGNGIKPSTKVLEFEVKEE